MHCLFLGIAKWIVKKIWVDEGVLTPDNLKNIQRKMNQIQVPADLGRIPRKIDRGEGFTTFTADQWRIFSQYMQQRYFGNICQQLIERF